MVYINIEGWYLTRTIEKANTTVYYYNREGFSYCIFFSFWFSYRFVVYVKKTSMLL